MCQPPSACFFHLATKLRIRQLSPVAFQGGKHPSKFPLGNFYPVVFIAHRVSRQCKCPGFKSSPMGAAGLCASASTRPGTRVCSVARFSELMHSFRGEEGDEERRRYFASALPLVRWSSRRCVWKKDLSTEQLLLHRSAGSGFAAVPYARGMAPLARTLGLCRGGSAHLPSPSLV